MGGVLYLVGTSGLPNYGDEFITAGWLRQLAQLRPDADIWLDCPHPGNAQVLFDGLHPHLHCTDTLWRAAMSRSDLAPADAAAHAGRLAADLGSPDFDLGLLQVRDAASLHLLGGGYINALWPYNIGVVTAMAAVSALSGARLFATGQGLLPAPAGLPRPRSLFGSFTYASSRDRLSAAAFGLRPGLDDALLALPPSRDSRSGFDSALLVCLQSDAADGGQADAAVAAARPVIAHAAAEGRPVYYLEAIPGADRVAYSRLADLIPEENFLPFAHLWRNGLPLAHDQQWLTTRFHFHLLGAASGAPGIALVVRQGYYDVKHRSLTELGSGWAVAAPGSGPQMPAGPGTLAAGLPTLQDAKRSEAELLYGTD